MSIVGCFLVLISFTLKICVQGVRFMGNSFNEEVWKSIAHFLLINLFLINIVFQHFSQSYIFDRVIIIVTFPQSIIIPEKYICKTHKSLRLVSFFNVFEN